MAWTDERVETLKKLWAEGLSASQIARAIGGGVTRNAVIGKIHRLGMAHRAKPPSSGGGRRSGASAAPRPRTQPSRPTAPSYPRQAKNPRDAALERAMRRIEPEPIMDATRKVTLLHLTDHLCKWPIGEPGDPAFRFCGRPSGPGSPYCRDHAIRAYQPAGKQDREASG